jgi:hypothetical protein
MIGSFASPTARTGLASALALTLFALPSLRGVPGARAAMVGPAAAPVAESSVAVDTSEVPDFNAALAQQLSVEAGEQAKEFGFDPSQILITLVWLDAASSSYGIHVYIETKDARLSDGPRGPLLSRCEQCSQTRVPEAAIEALMRGFELYEHTRKEQRKRNEEAEEQQRLDQQRNREALATAEQTIDEQEREARRLRRQRAAAAVLLSVGGAAHAVGITLMVLWKDGHSQGLELEGREYYIPGTVLLSLSPAPIAAGAVYLAGYVKAKKKPRATPNLIGLRRGFGLGATIRF